MKNLTLLCLIIFIFNSIAWAKEIRYSNCKDYQEDKLKDSFKDLKSKLNNLITQADNYPIYELTRREKRFLRKSRDILHCVEKKMNLNIEFKCMSDDEQKCNNARMYVVSPLFLKKILRKNRIHVCSSAIFNSKEEIGGLILHEATHLCGTEDLDYLLELATVNQDPLLVYKDKIDYEKVTTQKRVFPKLGFRNADSYRYWYYEGFCIPGRDCK